MTVEPFPWDHQPLILVEWTATQGDLYGSLLQAVGVSAGPSLRPFLPVRWSIQAWEYVAILTGNDPVKGLDRWFVGKSGSIGGVKRSEKSGLMVYEVDPDLLEVGSLVEIRSGSGGERYQRIYRRDQAGWLHVAYRLDRVGRWVGRFRGGHYNRRLFSPWILIQGIRG